MKIIISQEEEAEPRGTVLVRTSASLIEYNPKTDSYDKKGEMFNVDYSISREQMAYTRVDMLHRVKEYCLTKVVRDLFDAKQAV